ncbi:MAG: hypothetical protein KI785_10860 [Devosiaceae bacterium]|nr:hypothetical protein [Devosiaceae bacterium MH13]
MKRLRLSMMLMNTFAGVLAIMMLIIAALLVILAGANTARGEGDANTQILVSAGFFLIGGAGFYGLKNWARKTAAKPDTD